MPSLSILKPGTSLPEDEELGEALLAGQAPASFFDKIQLARAWREVPATPPHNSSLIISESEDGLKITTHQGLALFVHWLAVGMVGLYVALFGIFIPFVINPHYCHEDALYYQSVHYPVPACGPLQSREDAEVQGMNLALGVLEGLILLLILQRGPYKFTMLVTPEHWRITQMQRSGTSVLWFKDAAWKNMEGEGLTGNLIGCKVGTKSVAKGNAVATLELHERDAAHVITPLGIAKRLSLADREYFARRVNDYLERVAGVEVAVENDAHADALADITSSRKSDEPFMTQQAALLATLNYRGGVGSAAAPAAWVSEPVQRAAGAAYGGVQVEESPGGSWCVKFLASRNLLVVIPAVLATSLASSLMPQLIIRAVFGRAAPHEPCASPWGCLAWIALSAAYLFFVVACNVFLIIALLSPLRVAVTFAGERWGVSRGLVLFPRSLNRLFAPFMHGPTGLVSDLQGAQVGLQKRAFCDKRASGHFLALHWAGSVCSLLLEQSHGNTELLALRDKLFVAYVINSRLEKLKGTHAADGSEV